MAFEYLAEYATFQTVEGMDEAVEQHIQHHYYNLTESERAIVYALSKRSLMYPGASHLKADTIANALAISTKTVYRSIKKLESFSIIEKVAQSKLNGIKGASIYKILPFEIQCPIEMSERDTSNEPCYDAVSESFLENQSSSLNLLKSFKTCTTNIISNSITELENLALQVEKKKAYMNEYRQMLFDFLHALPMQDNLKDELHKIVLASQVDSVQAFHKAKNVMMNIVMDINNGTLTVSNTLRSVFAGAYSKANEHSQNELPSTTTTVEDKHEPVKKVAFYDWLNEREDNWQPSEVGQMNIQNWLEW